VCAGKKNAPGRPHTTGQRKKKKKTGNLRRCVIKKKKNAKGQEKNARSGNLWGGGEGAGAVGIEKVVGTNGLAAVKEN